MPCEKKVRETSIIIPESAEPAILFFEDHVYQVHQQSLFRMLNSQCFYLTKQCILDVEAFKGDVFIIKIQNLFRVNFLKRSFK